MTKYLLFAALVITGPAFAAAPTQPYHPWNTAAHACVAEYEKHYATGGYWIFDAARCTAKIYPPTQLASEAQVLICVEHVKRFYWSYCMACVDRLSAVMTCLTGQR
jgi:hypothetical protein